MIANFRFKAITLLSLLATAAPMALPEAEDIPTCIVQMYTGDTCDGQEDSYILAGQGSYGCRNVPSPRRSYLALGG